MSDLVDDRREFVQELEEHPLVDGVDFTRDGYETVILDMGGR